MDDFKDVLATVSRYADAFLAAHYTGRYQRILADLPQHVLFDSNRDGTLGTITDENLRERVVGLLRSYVDLCAEQHHLFRTGMISKVLWDYWRDGMKDNFRKMSALREVWTKLQKERDYADFNSELQTLLKETNHA